jgi:type VII secretion protein EccE
VASRPRRRVHSGQIVATQVAVVLIVVTAGSPAGLLAAALLLAVAFGWWRGRWLHQWARPLAGMVSRRRTATTGASTADLLALARPGIRLQEAGLDRRPAVVLSDGHGEVAVLEVGEPGGVLAEPLRLPVSGGSAGSTAAIVQALVTVRRAPAAIDPPGMSYHDLAGGGALTTRRVLLAVRSRPGNDLAATVRAVTRHLAPLPVRALPAAGLDDVLPQLAVTAPVRERLSSIHAGGLAQVTYRLPAAAADLLPRLLALPAAATTVSVTGDALFVRVACRTEQEVLAAQATLAALLAGRMGTACRLDGEHLLGVAATLPLGVPATPPLGLTGVAAGGVDAALTVDPAGVMLGHDAAGRPRLAALFGPEPARVVLIGDQRLARVLVWRGLGAGARITVHTAQPGAWWTLARAAGGAPLRVTGEPVPGDPLPGGTLPAGPGCGPALRLVDGGDAGAGVVPWASGADHDAAHVVVRPRVTAAEAPLLSRAGLVLTRALDEQESTLVTAALGLGRAGATLRGVDDDRLYAISAGTVTEVRMSLTASERRLIGSAAIDTVTR